MNVTFVVLKTEYRFEPAEGANKHGKDVDITSMALVRLEPMIPVFINIRLRPCGHYDLPLDPGFRPLREAADTLKSLTFRYFIIKG